MAVESMISGERILSSPTAPPTWHNALVSPSTNDSSEPKAATPRLTDPATSSELLLETPFHQLEPWPPVAPGHQESSSSDHEHPYLHLPPLHTVFPIIKRYFATCNPALPIFHEATFYAMVLDWYSSESSISTGRDPATWAVINATMALALRQTVDVGGFNDIRRQDDDRLAREYMANAQSVMDILVTRDEDFKGLQTILCLSLLFASSPAPKPACVLVATAVKLVHRLRAHTKEGKEGLDAATALHRDRLFWVTYVLDRDMAMKSLEPYIQQENEYDVEPPGPSIPEDGVGVLISPDGTQKINIFHYRVKLALIQGSLHDTVHSVRARSMCAKKAKAASERLGAALWEWRGSLPDVFQHNKLRSWAKEGGGVPRMLLQLHLTYMMCFFMSFRLHTRDPGWLRQLLEFSDQYAPGNIQLHEQGKDSDASFRGAAKITVMLPDHWKMFPDAAREALDLVRMVDDADTALVW